MTNEPTQSGGSDELDALKRENDTLRQKLERATSEAKEYRAAAYEFLDQIFPYVPPTEEELHELIHGPRGQSPLEVLEEFEKNYLRDES